MRRLDRSQWLALLGVAVLLVGALVLREDRSAAPGPDLTALQRAAALEPCPVGLGDALPDLVLPCLGGGPEVDLTSEAPGRPMLVNVWATWCAPCQDEVPDLVAFHEKAGDRVGLVGVLHQDTAARGLAFSRDFAIRYPSLVDPDGDVFRAYGAGLPTTLFLDAQGELVHIESGEIADLAELEGLVAQHLGIAL